MGGHGGYDAGWGDLAAGHGVGEDVGMTAAMPADPRAAVEYRVPAVDLRAGDLVNTSPGEDDWQQVIGVYRSPSDVPASAEDGVSALAETLGGRYVIVQLTDVAPVDSGVYFADGVPMTYGSDDDADRPVAEVVSSEDGVRTYLYTRFELVSVRATPA